MDPRPTKRRIKTLNALIRCLRIACMEVIFATKDSRTIPNDNFKLLAEQESSKLYSLRRHEAKPIGKRLPYDASRSRPWGHASAITQQASFLDAKDLTLRYVVHHGVCPESML